jgi:hypothetical protein
MTRDALRSLTLLFLFFILEASGSVALCSRNQVVMCSNRFLSSQRSPQASKSRKS